KGHQKKLEEELGNLSQKIEKIILNYDTLNEQRTDESHGESRWRNDKDQERHHETRKGFTCYNYKETSHITHNCLLEKKLKRDYVEK
ncbi:6070_t:CDS:1, partial [Cetraspora pellucida]